MGQRMITYKRELITPQRAKQLLASNADNNRQPRTAKIKQYARDMTAGRWHSNTAEFIKVDVNGMVIDGQNRLHAVVLADTPIYLDVAYDVPSDAMQVIDTGASRTAADALKIAGATERMVGASVVRWVIMWDNDMPTGSGKLIFPTISEISETYLKEPGLYDGASRRGADCRRAGLGTATPAAVAHVLFSRIEQELTHQFFDQYLSGANLPERSAVLALRNRMARLRVDRMTRAEQLALFVRGWNAFRDSKPLDRMIIVKGELTNMNFPRPK